MDGGGRAIAVVLVGAFSGLAGCVYYPTTDGFHVSLPESGTSIVVWGGHPSATGPAMIWLQRRGLVIVERAQLQRIFDEQKIRLTHTPEDEGAVLTVGRLVGAQQVVFVDSPVQAGLDTPDFYTGHVPPQYTSYNTSVTIRGVDVESGQVRWSGHAQYVRPFQSLDLILRQLTCDALATAWGFRPTGNHEIPSQEMCEVVRANQ